MDYCTKYGKRTNFFHYKGGPIYAIMQKFLLYEFNRSRRFDISSCQMCYNSTKIRKASISRA